MQMFNESILHRQRVKACIPKYGDRWLSFSTQKQVVCEVVDHNELPPKEPRYIYGFIDRNANQEDYFRFFISY